MVHQKCIVRSLGSIGASRNKCPECRQTLCQINVLSPEQEAARHAEAAQHFDAMVAFNTNAYKWVVEQTDAKFQRQYKTWRLLGAEDYVRIYGSVRQRWHQQYPISTDTFICDENREIGDDWLEYAIAQRVRRLVLDDGESRSKARYLFLAHFDAMEENFAHFHNSVPPDTITHAIGSIQTLTITAVDPYDSFTKSHRA
jgi:hypothetical protein